MGPDPAVAAVRLAVRPALAGAGRARAGRWCWWLARAGLTRWPWRRLSRSRPPGSACAAGGVTVDHGLQPGSADQAARVAAHPARAWARSGRCLRVEVAARGRRPGRPGGGRPAARYAALDGGRGPSCGAAAVLLGHTLDDQAETVLLGLARGSGARSLAGMAAASGRYLRPLLGVRRRGQTVAACAAQGLRPGMTRRTPTRPTPGRGSGSRSCPRWTRLLGPGVAEALARTADLLRADADALDAMAAAAAERLAVRADGGLDVAGLAALPAAIRTRLLQPGRVAAGCPARLADRAATWPAWTRS